MACKENVKVLMELHINRDRFRSLESLQLKNNEKKDQIHQYLMKFHL